MRQLREHQRRVDLGDRRHLPARRGGSRALLRDVGQAECAAPVETRGVDCRHRDARRLCGRIGEPLPDRLSDLGRGRGNGRAHGGP